MRLYTILLSGPTSVTLSTEGNPPLAHTGGNTVGHMVLSEEEAQILREQVLPEGCTLTVIPMAGRSDEQEKEQLALLNGQERVWPCASCPTCPWLDPLREDPCGYRSWPEETVVASVEEWGPHAIAAVACPVLGLKNGGKWAR